MSELSRSRLAAGNVPLGILDSAKRRTRRDLEIEVLQMVWRKGSTSPEVSLSLLISFNDRLRESEV